MRVKDTGGWSIGKRPTIAGSSPLDSKRLQYGGIVAAAHIIGTRITRSWSHPLIVGSTAALRRNPGDIAVGILDVAGFAMDAVLRVDLVERSRAFLDPFVDAGRAIAIRRSGKYVMLGRLLQVHVGDLEMNRLVLLMVGVGQEYRRQLVEGQLAVRLRCGNRRMGLGRVQRLAVGLGVRLGS